MSFTGLLFSVLGSVAAVTHTLPQADVVDAMPLVRGISLNCGGTGAQYDAVPQEAFQCLRLHNATRASFSVSGWAPVPSYYNISAMVESVRNARDAGLTITITLWLDELHLPPSQMLPTLEAIVAAELRTSIDRVFVAVEGDPIIWGSGKSALSFMLSTVEQIQSLSFTAGIQTNNVQWSWIMADITKEELLPVAKLPLWYDSGDSRPTFEDFSSLSNLGQPAGPWASPTAKTYDLDADITACGYQGSVEAYVYREASFNEHQYTNSIVV